MGHYITIDELGIDIHLVKEGEVLSPHSHSSQKFIHGIKLLMAKQYVNNLSEEVKKGLREKAEQGLPPNRVPLGYRYVEGSEGRRVVIVDEDVAAAVKRMRQSRNTDVTLTTWESMSVPGWLWTSALTLKLGSGRRERR